MKKAFRYLASILITALVFCRLGQVLGAVYDGNQAMDGFYKMEKNTVDVVFYGSSHIYAGVNTAKLWNDHGIAGYDFAGTMQTLWNSYYNMVETVKYQSPKIMVVDLYGALIEEEYYTSANVIKNVSSMRFSVNKIKNVWSSVPHDAFLTYLLSYPLTHDSFREIKQINYDGETGILGGKWFKGFHAAFGATEFEQLPVPEANPKKKEPTDKNRKYLRKMIDFTEKNGIKLAFIVVPYAGISKEDEAIYQWCREFAKENGIPFLDGNRRLTDMGFHPKTDFAEESHLNYSGACKFTAYLGEWLMEECELEDRRGNIAYDSWQKYSDCWAAFLQNQELKGCRDVEAYLEKLKSCTDYEIFVSLDDNYKLNSYTEMLGELTESEIPGNSFENEGTFVIADGEIVYMTPEEPEYLWHMETDSLDIAVVKEYGEEMALLVNNEKMNDNYNDITILVYDKRLDGIADVVGFNRDGVMR